MTAKTVRLGESQGPNEDRSFETLAKNLPEDWYVVANRLLDTQKHEEVDFFVIGKNTIFVLEEKSWGPKVIFGDARWTVTNGSGTVTERVAPFRNLSNKAKVTASWLRDSISGFNNVRGPFVFEMVLLSHPKIEIGMRIGVNDTGSVFKLDEICQAMLKIDEKNQGNYFFDHRNSVIGKIIDIPPRQIHLPRIKDYKVTELVSKTMVGESAILTYAAEHQITHKEFHLQCHRENVHSNNPVDAQKLLKRYFEVAERLFYTQRIWKQSQPFLDDENDFIVYPYEKPQGAISLAEISNLETSEFLQIRSNALNLARDGFSALSDLAHHDIFHRTLAPSCIWIAQSSRILFSDFFMAHNNGTVTVQHLEDSSEHMELRAPESRVNIFLSDAKSDIYTFAKVFIDALKLDDQFTESENSLEEESRIQLLSALKLCINQDPSQRPSALEALALISPPEVEQDEPVEALEEIRISQPFGSDFEVIGKLGEGGGGVSWKANYIDSSTGSRSVVVIKSPHSENAFTKLKLEFANGEKLREACSRPDMRERLTHCSIGKEVRQLPNPGFIVNSYMSGIKLKEFADRRSPSIEQYTQLFLSALDILEAIDSANWIHGDISPNNILVDEENLQAQFIDFGEARIFGSYAFHFGTQLTYAPEVAHMNTDIDGRADLYSLGATFLYTILGHPHRNLNSDTSEFFKPNELMDHERQQYHDSDLNFLRVLIDIVNPNRDLRPSYKVIRERIANYEARYITYETVGLEIKVNRTVDAIRSYYTASDLASAAAIAELPKPERDIHDSTYVSTLLETQLLPEILKSRARTLMLTGNPGGGKTAFLLEVKRKLLLDGGTSLIESSDDGDNPEWKIRYNGVVFHAVLDASQSIQERDADFVVAEAIRGVLNDGNVALIAINDGRLRQFTRNYGEDFPALSDRIDEYFSNSELEISDDVIIVDLKNRSVVDLNGNGFFKETVEAFTQSSLWETCNSCKLREICPINQNRKTISEPQVLSTLTEMVQYTYLRRIERPNFRRVRSAIAFLVTGDMGCGDIAEKLQREEDLSYLEFQNLLFGDVSQESLIRGWAEFDPALRISPRLKETLKLTTPAHFGSTATRSRYTREARKTYLSQLRGLGKDTNLDILPYRHFTKFLEYIRKDVDSLEPILQGLSRISGAHLEYQNGLALAEIVSSSGWVVMKVIPEDSFQIEVDQLISQFLETTPQSITLVHKPSNRRFMLTLDVFEILMRSAAGELFNDYATSALRFEMQAFASSILRSPVSEVQLLNPSGESFTILKKDNVLVLDQGGIGFEN